MLGCRVPVMPRKKLATSLFRARPVRWVQPKDSRLVATSDSRREKENWTEVDSQRSVTVKLAETVLRLSHRVSVSSALMRVVSTAELATLGEDVTDSRTLTQRFFHFLSFSYNLHQKKPLYADQIAERLRTHR